MSLTPNALHMAERDGQLSAIRALYSLRWHLDAHDTSMDSQQAAIAFLDGFVGVFSECIAAAWPDTVDGAGLSDASVGRLVDLYDAITDRTHDLIQRLDR
ncbi:hypothetical protein NH8B_0507 [Pseudogulbenkiania sp. NH8B]|uniref:hypothetical protein n=1 Tax=Pseudogulbenkiania sp. (strain NH8B) TaxID=748280 RepID=UPI000227946E|nr:hypothetical protein [Pseudogulbenkiania sp. NH8B]BAK75342.1 hypothetical protein NH8B_0507 [Pseudogulbenkiania sp. NH8B]